MQSFCLTIFGGFHVKSMSITFWHVPALQPFCRQDPGLELLAIARGTCGKWMSLRWTSALQRALGSLSPAKLQSSRQDDAETMSERKELFYYKSISRSPLSIPGVSFVLLPHPTINLLKRSRLSEMSSC